MLPVGSPPAFSTFAAIDWSGARGLRHKGIAVAVAAPGDAPPHIVAPPRPGGWARAEVAEWLEALPGAVLAGFDFSFAPPFVTRGAYLPGSPAPDTAPEFWQWLESRTNDADYGAGSFLETAERRHFWFGAADGRKAGFMHFRACETAFNAGGGGKASTVFDCVGAAQVAKASFAGMRVLNRLRQGFAIWPFDPPRDRTVVEIYTRAFIRLAGMRGLKVRGLPDLQRALAALGSTPWPGTAFTDHESDALIAAAGLRAIAGDRRFWNPDGLTPAIARTEGWTFGIP